MSYSGNNTDREDIQSLLEVKPRLEPLPCRNPCVAYSVITVYLLSVSTPLSTQRPPIRDKSEECFVWAGVRYVFFLVSGKYRSIIQPQQTVATEQAEALCTRYVIAGEQY